MNSSVNSIIKPDYYNSSTIDSAESNIVFRNISDLNKNVIMAIKSFIGLPENWDTYGATKPSSVAIQKAISFVIWLSNLNIDVFFTAPSPDGDILVELKHGDANLEFEFSSDNSDSICASQYGEFVSEEELNESTQIAYLKWLISPNGNI